MSTEALFEDGRLTLTRVYDEPRDLVHEGIPDMTVEGDVELRDRARRLDTAFGKLGVFLAAPNEA